MAWSSRICPLFRDERVEFCSTCDIDPEGIDKDIDMTVLIGRCIDNMNIAIDTFETEEKITLEKIDNITSGILLKLYRMINNGEMLNADNINAINTLLNRFRVIEYMFGPRRSKFCVEIGNLYIGLKNFERAIEWYDKATMADVENKDAWNNKGLALTRTGKPNMALRFYDIAIRIDEKYEQAWFNKGKALYRLKRPKEALECFRKVVEINPNNVCARNNEGLLWRIIGKPKKAIKCYDTALSITPNYLWAWYNRGRVLEETGKYDEGIASFTRALIIDPRFRPARQKIEEYRRRMGRRRGGGFQIFKRKKEKEGRVY